MQFRMTVFITDMPPRCGLNLQQSICSKTDKGNVPEATKAQEHPLSEIETGSFEGTESLRVQLPMWHRSPKVL